MVPLAELLILILVIVLFSIIFCVLRYVKIHCIRCCKRSGEEDSEGSRSCFCTRQKFASSHGSAGIIKSSCCLCLYECSAFNSDDLTYYQDCRIVQLDSNENEGKGLLKKNISDRSNIHVSNCAVCLEGCQKGHEIVILSCGHSYHNQCILPWLESHSQCPLCKEFVTKKVVYPIIEWKGEKVVSPVDL